MRPALTRRGGAAGVLALALSFACPPALADASSSNQGSAAAQPVEVARMRYRQGVEAYKAGRYRESIDYFLEADRASPSAALSFNIALAYEKIDDAAAALRWYRDYLRRSPDAKDRAAVEGTIHEFEARLSAKGVQQVTVLSTPPGATLVIDDTPVGVTPFTLELPPGDHRVELRRDGYETARQSVSLPADHAVDVAVTLQAASSAAPAEPPVASPPPTAPEAPPSPSAEHTRSGGAPFTTLGIVGMAAGGAALGGALTFEILRRSAESDAKNERTQVAYADQVDTMQSRQTVARVLLGAGVVLAATGGILFYVGKKQDAAKDTAVGFACAPGGCASVFHGKF